MNKLISFGDSFTWGSDLSDALDGHPTNEDSEFFDPYKTHHHNNGRKIGQYSEVDHKHRVLSMYSCYSRLTWPALLANSLDKEYVCYAVPGASNQTITRQFFQYLPYISTDDIVVVNWTWIDRWEVFTEHDERQKQWTVLRPSGSDNKKLNQFYFKHLQSELWNKLETLKMILLLINTLKIKKIKFLMTSIDKLIISSNYHSPSYVSTLQNEVMNDIAWFNEEGFYDWCKNNEFPISETGGHPLEEAHAEAFKYVKEHCDFTC